MLLDPTTPPGAQILCKRNVLLKFGNHKTAVQPDYRTVGQAGPEEPDSQKRNRRLSDVRTPKLLDLLELQKQQNL